MNPVTVEEEIRRLVDHLEDATVELAALAESAGVAEVTAKVAFAKAFLAKEGPVAAREHLATVATEQQLLARRVAEAKLMAQRELLTTIRTQIDALRTLSASMRVLA